MHLGLIGFGSIAASLAELLPDTRVTQVTVLVRPAAKAGPQPDAKDIPVQFVTHVDELIGLRPDLVVECAGHSAVADHVPSLLQAGADTVVVSVGALADERLHAELCASAAQGAARIILPSGAIGGLDILRAITQQCEVELTYRGIKPARAWEGSAAENLVDLSALEAAKTFYKGSGRQAALAFPKNANVVAALALAGAGFDKMKVELIADPNAQSNQHSYSVVSPLCCYSIAIEATPSAGNAKTSFTTVLSVLKEIADYQIVR